MNQTYLIMMVVASGALLISLLVSVFFLVKSGVLDRGDDDGGDGQDDEDSQWGPDWCGGNTALCAVTIAALGLDAVQLTKEIYDLAKWGKEKLDEKKQQALNNELDNICQSYSYQRM